MKNILLLMLMFITSTTQSSDVNHIQMFEATLPTIVVAHWQKIPNIDTLANYIMTQSKNDTLDINSMVQVMLNRFNKSDFNSFGDMLYSKGNYGSHSVKSGGGRYWFSERSKKYLPKVHKEIQKVLSGEKYHDMSNIYYFSNHQCTYHTRNPAYKFMFKTPKHKYFAKSPKKL